MPRGCRRAVPAGPRRGHGAVRKAWPYVNAGAETHDGYTRFVIRCCDDRTTDDASSGPRLIARRRFSRWTRTRSASRTSRPASSPTSPRTARQIPTPKCCSRRRSGRVDAAGANRPFVARRRRDDAHEGGGLLPDLSSLVSDEATADARRAAPRLSSFVCRAAVVDAGLGFGVRDALRADGPPALRRATAPRRGGTSTRGARPALLSPSACEEEQRGWDARCDAVRASWDAASGIRRRGPARRGRRAAAGRSRGGGAGRLPVARGGARARAPGCDGGGGRRPLLPLRPLPPAADEGLLLFRECRRRSRGVLLVLVGRRVGVVGRRRGADEPRDVAPRAGRGVVSNKLCRRYAGGRRGVGKRGRL